LCYHCLRFSSSLHTLLPHPTPTPFPYTTLFRSPAGKRAQISSSDAALRKHGETLALCASRKTFASGKGFFSVPLGAHASCVPSVGHTEHAGSWQRDR